jgi:hypothetical protein
MRVIDAQHLQALDMGAVLEELQHQTTEYLMDLRLGIHAYSGSDTSGWNTLFAARIDEILAERS